mmetsp:Transcript_47666/g.85808  ORF Transcript_47666/g.85808 Transcript_47666/m.85808 type:complete len:330 (+) Transcript_47666:47-1036(+)|eukprot:CAMPEP_0197653728 /NCGR_PEP_ID=MMETSP1338-20131121/36862_1 /TAXON_ID=43686 ORGANISM="Pelagodinium beii, Strain RCC1491" /NCGR_SAMPLE_ID=MMETSP1338 /ASSEMBLY_ACC=CAM_ASM_000754 /LENGTH=329 /DNA_ID=CAMNT_0043228947 /DNA_START=42 /DNA_END=1031 /DNA_ORIENTATION=+
MGGSSSRASFSANQPSPGDAKKLSVLSDSLDDVKFTDESFWKYLGELKREPVPLPMFAKALGVHIANHTVTDRDDGSFLVKTVIGGYYGKEVDVNFTHTYDVDTNTWTQVCDRDPNMQKMEITLCFRLLDEPRRIEAWCVNEKARNAGPDVAAAAHSTIAGILEKIGKPTDGLEVKAEQPSLDGSGSLVAQSGALDSLTYDELFEHCEQSIRDGKGHPAMAEFAITDDKGHTFKATEVIDADGTQQTNYAEHIFDASKGEMYSIYYMDDTYATKKFWYTTKVYKSPLRLELHNESEALRHAGPDVVKVVQEQVEGVLEKAVAETAQEEQ